MRPPPAPFRAPAWCPVTAGRRRQGLHVFVEVRRTGTRPLFVRYSRAPSRPRALARLLQADVSTSTTTDHFEHPERPESVVGTTACIDRKLPFDWAIARASQGQGSSNTVARRSPPELLPAETLPRPCSLRAPPVARTVLLPVRSDVGKGRNRRRSTHLHGARHERVVRRSTSAKRRNVHQPEGPSIVRPSRYCERA